MTTQTNNGKEIADTTLKYLGGFGRLSAMIGAKDFSYDKEGTLAFKFKMCKKANCVKFKLNGKDLYDVEFYKAGRFDFKVVKEYNDLYFDQLRKIFEEYTGLYLSL